MLKLTTRWLGGALIALVATIFAAPASAATLASAAPIQPEAASTVDAAEAPVVLAHHRHYGRGYYRSGRRYWRRHRHGYGYAPRYYGHYYKPRRYWRRRYRNRYRHYGYGRRYYKHHGYY